MIGRGVVRRSLVPTLVGVVSMGLALTVVSVPSGASRTAKHGGVVTFAEDAGTPPGTIFPVVNGFNSGNANLNFLQPMMFLPLYWHGSSRTTTTTVNYKLSIGQAPKLSNGGKTITIKLNKYKWSTGAPVTGRDLTFFMNIILNEKTNVFFYSPGGWMDHVVSYSSPTPTTFVLRLSARFNSNYILDNALSVLTPIPQQAWDKTSASGAVGNYDETPAGAKRVYKFLHGQSQHRATWATNPLWKVVDGPWRLKPKTGYDVTGRVIFVPNPRYSGTNKPRVSEFEELPFTSATAEYNALRSGGVDYGYIPTTDVGNIPALKRQGFSVKPWYEWGLTWITVNYSNPKYGHLVGQLYIRQAIESLVDQPLYIKTLLNGFGVPTYGPVPLAGKSRFLTKASKVNPYPYSPARAKRLLKAHGWTIPSSGPATCTKAGSASTQCGPGIPKGTKLEIPLSYSNAAPTLGQEVQALQTTLKKVGIVLSIKAGPQSTVGTGAYACQGKTMAKCPASSPVLSLTNSPTYEYEPAYYATGATVYACGAVTDGGNYCNKQVDALIQAADTEPTPAAMTAYHKFAALLSKDVPFLWFPSRAYRISAISPKLGGVDTQGPNAYLYPSTWFVK